MIQSLERHLDDVVVGIVGNAEQRQPLRFDLIAKAQRGDLDFGLFAFERGGDAIEETVPLLFVELAGGHGKSPMWDKVRNGCGACSACPDCERAPPGVAGTAVRPRTFWVSGSSKVRGLRRGEPMRVRSVQLGGSLAGKLSSKLSSILSSDVAAVSNCGWRLRRAT